MWKVSMSLTRGMGAAQRTESRSITLSAVDAVEASRNARRILLDECGSAAQVIVTTVRACGKSPKGEQTTESVGIAGGDTSDD